MFIKMLYEEQDEEDSKSVISEAEDLDFVPQDQAGVVGVSWNPALRNEEGRKSYKRI